MKGFKRDELPLPEDPEEIVREVQEENRKELSIEEMPKMMKIENYLKCVDFQIDFSMNLSDAMVRNQRVAGHLEKKAKEVCRTVYYEK